MDISRSAPGTRSKQTSPPRSNTDRARQHITVLAEEAQKAIEPDATDGGSVFMSGVVNGLTMARRVLDGASAEQALESMEATLATVVGRLYLSGELKLTPDTPPVDA